MIFIVGTGCAVRNGSDIRIASHRAARAAQGTGMKTKYVEKALAFAGTVLVLIAVGAAANSALADEATSADTKLSTTQATTDASLAIAESAGLAAASDAVDALIDDTRLDLDIRMLDHSSTLLADRS